MIPAPVLPTAALTGIASFLQGSAVAAYLAAQALLLVYCAHRYSILLRRRKAPRVPALPTASVVPFVTVQLPVFNERRVIERLIGAVAALDYPREYFEIQVLDDSTDETTAIARACVAREKARGVNIRLLRRERREGYKAGALGAGLACARGELVAVFDADFVPRPDFLTRMVPHFADPKVGLVQARWGHLNRGESALTAAQAVMLDAHFLLEHAVRMSRGLFLNFNGTAGVWRRTCIEEAGGWSHDTLTEDLDLSYRAQLRGWKFVFDPSIEVPAELPADMEAFKSQQRRWAKGSIQTARKLLPSVWRGPLPFAVKLEAFFHLTSNLAYPLLLALGLLLLPVLLGRSMPPVLVWVLHAGVVLLGLVPVAWFLAAGSRRAGVRKREVPGVVLAALVVGIGLSANNARAVLEALGPRVGDWERTPKRGDARRAPGVKLYRPIRRFAGRWELALALYFAAVLGIAVAASQYRALPFLALLVAGFTIVGGGSWRETRGAGVPASAGSLLP